MSRYWRFVVPALVGLAVVVALLLQLSSNLVFFNTPTELVESPPSQDARLRLGGQVAEGTVAVAGSGGSVVFVVTDGRRSIEVHHRGAPQQLFAEGRGVVVEGTFDGSVFHSDTMLVKHDEQYRTEDTVYEPGIAPEEQ